jgi:hypothetical protein
MSKNRRRTAFFSSVQEKFPTTDENTAALASQRFFQFS